MWNEVIFWSTLILQKGWMSWHAFKCPESNLLATFRIFSTCRTGCTHSGRQSSSFDSHTTEVVELCLLWNAMFAVHLGKLMKPSVCRRNDAIINHTANGWTWKQVGKPTASQTGWGFELILLVFLQKSFFYFLVFAFVFLLKVWLSQKHLKNMCACVCVF